MIVATGVLRVASAGHACENTLTLLTAALSVGPPEPLDVPNATTTDPLLRHSRREAIVIGLAWLGATAYCCTYSYLFGYIREGHPLTRDDVRPVFGIPSWVFWGVIVPWGVSAVFTFWFAGWYVADDDLGQDHSAELEGDIRDGGLHE